MSKRVTIMVAIVALMVAMTVAPGAALAAQGSGEHIDGPGLGGLTLSGGLGGNDTKGKGGGGGHLSGTTSGGYTINGGIGGSITGGGGSGGCVTAPSGERQCGTIF